MKVLHTPLSREDARALRCGESCLITGTIYTARDAAHKRLCELAAKGKPLPFDIEGAIIYFVGPTPAKPGQIIGSAGPTTSYRMDAYSPTLIALGQTGMIGKGKRGEAVVDAMRRYGAVYLAPSAPWRTAGQVREEGRGHRLSRPRRGSRSQTGGRKLPGRRRDRQRGQ